MFSAIYEYFTIIKAQTQERKNEFWTEQATGDR